jgi:hypothetical protein
MFSLKPDYEQTRARMQAFWARDVLDRPLTTFWLLKPADELELLPESHHATSEERWTDTQFQTELAVASLSNQLFLGDTLPIAWPNLGPEVFSALYGCPLHFGDYGTSWTDPILHDWSQADALCLDWNHPYLRKLHEMTDALLEAGRDKFIVGMTDWHPGGDAIAAFRDPMNLAMDMIDHLDEVKRLLARVEADYYRLYDMFYEKLHAAGQPCTSWTPLICDGRYYIPSNDFSIMVSPAMYDDVFLPGLRRECQHLNRSIYHLDGPGALTHLDSVLSIPELDALQFVFGAGNEGFHRWVKVYQTAQARGKSIQVNCSLRELPQIMQTLSPKGLYLNIDGVNDRETAENMLRELERWTREERRGDGETR